MPMEDLFDSPLHLDMNQVSAAVALLAPFLCVVSALSHNCGEGHIWISGERCDQVV